MKEDLYNCTLVTCTMCTWRSYPSIIKRSIWSLRQESVVVKKWKTSDCILTGFEVGRGDMLGETGETKWLVTFNREEIPGLCIAAGHQHSAECMVQSNWTTMPLNSARHCCTPVRVCLRFQIQICVFVLLYLCAQEAEFSFGPPLHRPNSP